MLVVWHSSPGYSRLCITTRSQDVSLPIFHTVLYGLNCEGPQTNMPQNIGSINDLTSKNIHWVDTKLIVLREKFAWHQHDTERNKNRVARSRTQINQGEFIRVVTWYMGSGLKAQNITGIRAHRKGLRAQKNGIRDHKVFEPESGIRFITQTKNLLSQYFSAS